jgi:hypothetical protein
MGNSCSVSLSQFPALFCTFFFLSTRNSKFTHRQLAGKSSSFLTARFEISGYPSVKLTQTLERGMVANFYFSIKSLSISINSSYSLIAKFSIENEPMKGFLSQLLSLLFGENVLQTSFVIMSEMFSYVRRYTFWYRCMRLIKIPIHHNKKKNLI